MDIKIPPPEGKIKDLGQPITFEDVVRHRQESTFPQYFRRHGDTITPPRIRYVDDDGRDEDEGEAPHDDHADEEKNW